MVAGQADPFITDLVDLMDDKPVVPAIKTVMADVSKDEAWLNVRPPLTKMNRSVREELVAKLHGLAARPAA